MKQKIPKVEDWILQPRENPYIIVDPNSDYIRLNMERISKKLPNDSIIHSFHKDAKENIGCFLLHRDLFKNQIDYNGENPEMGKWNKYLDYFFEFFDPQKKVFSGLIYIKTQIDKAKVSKPLTKFEILDLVQHYILSRTDIKNQLYKLVDINYDIDITLDKNGNEVFIKTYDLNNENGKQMFAISYALKIILLILTHYIASHPVLSKMKSSCEECIEPQQELSFLVFEKIGSFKKRNLSSEALLIKLYNFITQQIAVHSKQHEPLWGKLSALRGETERSKTNDILRNHLISDNLFKLRFNKNLMSFIKSVVSSQLGFGVQKIKYKRDSLLITPEKDINGISGVDRAEAILAKMNEIQVVRCKFCLSSVLDNLEKEYGSISDDELEYYLTHWNSHSKFHKMLINYKYVHLFGNMVELKSKSDIQNIKFMIYAKRQFKKENSEQISWLFSSVQKGTLSNRTIKNQKFQMKLKQTVKYNDLINNTYKELNEIDMERDVIQSIISKVMANSWTYVEYENQELTGTPIEFDEDIVSDELMTLIDNI